MKLAPEKPTLNDSQYTLLRTILDSLETGALRYYMSATSEAERDANFKYLRDKLTPIIDHLWQKQKADPCPDGYYNCDGYCVSYPCTN
jgi:hypothetical protein